MILVLTIGLAICLAVTGYLAVRWGRVIDKLRTKQGETETVLWQRRQWLADIADRVKALEQERKELAQGVVTKLLQRAQDCP